MELEGDAIIITNTSSEMLKPSAATPAHLKYHNLSLLDRFFGFTYVPQVLFYSSIGANNDVAWLKESLSETLSLFYPLAGRLTTDETAVDCNDEGISFVEAQANCTLVDFLNAPDRVQLVTRFVPGVLHEVSTLDKLVLLAVQVTVFECGGFAIGSQYLHKIFDGVSWGVFLKTWAAIAAKRNEDVVVPDFDTALSLYPSPYSWTSPDPVSRKTSRTLTVRALDNEAEVVDGGCYCVVKAFVFTPDAVADLQDMARSERVPNPTRIEAVSGFIWKHLILAASAVSDSLGPSVLIHSVNMRPRTDPPLPPTVIGNLITNAAACFDCDDQAEKSTIELPDLVADIRKGLSTAKDTELLSKFQGDEGAEFLRQHKQKLADISNNDTNRSTYKFTSWSWVHMNADFGSGMPVWIGFAGGKLSFLLRNFTPLIEIPGYGIEAWLILDEQEMDILQSDIEFLRFASLTT